MGLFSITTLLGIQQKLEIKSAAWYAKQQPTFSDAIAAVQCQIWLKQKLLTPLFQRDVHNLYTKIFKQLISNATRAA